MKESFSDIPFGIPFWIIKKPTFFGRLKNFLNRLNPIPKELRPMTKKKLQVKITRLERDLIYQQRVTKDWWEFYEALSKKYKALQQAICDLVEKAELTYIKKGIVVPDSPPR